MLITLSIVVVVYAVFRLVSAIIGGMSKASDITYYLCRPFIFPMGMGVGFFGWIALFTAAGFALKYIIEYLAA